MCLHFDPFFLICLRFSSYLCLFCMTRETIVALWWDKLNGAATWSILRFVLFIITSFAFPTSPLLHPRESYLSCAHYTAKNNEFFMSSPRSNSRAKERCEKGGETRAGGLIYVRCQYKQNDKYNLAFSLCRDNGQHEAQTRLKQISAMVYHPLERRMEWGAG